MVLCGATQRIRMLTCILALAYRHPLLLAKQISTMEFLAGGRFTLGTAVGHLEKEFEALGVPFDKRGRITDEYLQALKAAGTTSVQVMPPKVATFEQCLEWTEWYDSEIIPKFR